ncbi:hypothetical protein [Clostridium brassicae]|uniref:Transposase n=1 Tax=Clostridium brassicae TaxID=2999072 RepID=A0ABT4DAM4_9CLOT|nr:hypothetical protein [Clostridium brassicae]MCY6959357.1 hypothetical protein [Clostridium brassicae]
MSFNKKPCPIKLENINENSATVYYVKAINKTDKYKALMQWK